MIEFVALLIVLAILGVIDAGYLTWKHYRKQPLVCPLNSKCEVVTESRWSHMFGVRNELLGLVYYLLVLVAAFYLFFTNAQIKLYLIILTGGAFVFSLFLIYLQSYVIKSYCFYCLISALISFLIFLNVIIL